MGHRQREAQMWHQIICDQLSLYSCSFKASNPRELMKQPDIDVALVAGVSLKADEFVAIATAANRQAHDGF